MRFARRVPSAAVLLLALAALTPDPARAFSRAWINPFGGTAGSAGFWNPPGVPGTNDTLVFDLNNTYTMTFGGVVTTTRAHFGEQGGVSYVLQVPHAVLGNFVVGRVAAQPCTLGVTSGQLTVVGDGQVGRLAGRTGTLTATGSASKIIWEAGSLSVGTSAGTGVFRLDDGATSTLFGGLQLGVSAGANGTIRIRGVDPADASKRSTFDISGNALATAFDMGTATGTGRIEVTNGGLFTTDRIVNIAKDSASVGSLYVGGASTADSARIIQKSLNVGHSSALTGRGGTGTVTVESGGVLEVQGRTTYPDPMGGGPSKLSIRDGGRMITNGLDLWDPATQFDHKGGRLQIKGSVLELNGHALDLNSTIGSPQLDLLNNAQCDLTSATAPTLRLGRTGQGHLNVLGGSDLHVISDNALIGDNAGSAGSLEVADAGSTFTADHAVIAGRAGQGDLVVRDGAHGTVFSLGVATQATGSGTVVVDEPGSSLHVTDDFEVAGLSTGASGGSGVVSVSDDAQLWLDKTGVTGNLWATGGLFVLRGGTVHLAGALGARGTVALIDGSIQGGVLTPVSPALITGSGDIGSAIVAAGDTGTTIHAGGTLLLGAAGSPLGFQFPGTLDVGAYTVTLRDADSAVVGTVLLNGGTLNAPAGGMHVPAGRRLAGTGSVNGAIRPVGRVLATGTEGLAFGGPVLGVGQGMNGTKFRFRAGSSFIGFGRLEASVQVDSGATILPVSDLTLGSFPAVSTVGIAGSLLVGPGVEVDLNGSDTTRVDGTLVLNRGFLFPLNAPLWIRTNGVLQGNGSVTGSALLSGTLDPGTGTRLVSLTDLRIAATGRVLFDVGNHHAGVLDSIAVSGSARLGGTLDLRLLPGFTQVAGDSFLVLSAGSITGTFANLTLNGGSSAGFVQLRYRPNAVWAVVLVSGLDAPGEGPGAPHALRFASLGSPSRTLAFALELPGASDVQVELFDVGGRRLAKLHDGPLAAGRHAFRADAAAMRSGGLCFARATVRDGGGTRTLVARAIRLP